MTSLDPTWSLVLPYPKPPLSMNDRGDWSKHYGKQQAVKHQAAVLIRAAATPAQRAEWPLDHVAVEFVWCVKDNHRRDEDNLMGTAKYAFDGLVDAGLVKDDVPRYMTKVMPRIDVTRDPALLAHPVRLDVTACQRLAWPFIYVERFDRA